MKKIVTLGILVLVVASIFCGTVVADISVGPAENSGDGISDGSGFPTPNYQNEPIPGMGPAPNSGDGVSDGSGFP
jgi:hypothetical protein